MFWGVVFTFSFLFFSRKFIIVPTGVWPRLSIFISVQLLLCYPPPFLSVCLCLCLSLSLSLSLSLPFSLSQQFIRFITDFVQAVFLSFHSFFFSSVPLPRTLFPPPPPPTHTKKKNHYCGHLNNPLPQKKEISC